MPDSARPPYVPADTLTPERNITHRHFRAGDHVVVLTGVVDGQLTGDAMTVVAPSWHTPTDEDGWRLRNPHGAERTYITAHPRYMVHTSRTCPDCLIHRGAMERYRLPRFTGARGALDCSWYSLTHLNQLVHIDDARSSR